MNTSISLNNHNPMIAGIEITTDEHGRFNLNALHRASGMPETKAPNQWLRSKTAQELISALKEDQTANSQFGTKTRNCEPVEAVRGGATPGTFAHELIAVSYAGWISPAFQLKVNQVFIDYRTGKLQPAHALAVPQTLSEALRLAADLADEMAAIKPKAEALNRIAASPESLTLTQAAKVLNLKVRDLTAHLHANGWIYRQNGSWVGYQVHIQNGNLEYKEAHYTDEKTGLSCIRPYCHITQRGMTRLAEQLATRH